MFQSDDYVHISGQINSSELRVSWCYSLCRCQLFVLLFQSFSCSLCVWFRAVHQFNEFSFTSDYRLWNLTCYAIYRNNLYPTTVTIIDPFGQSSVWRRKQLKQNAQRQVSYELAAATLPYTVHLSRCDKRIIENHSNGEWNSSFVRGARFFSFQSPHLILLVFHS